MQSDFPVHGKKLINAAWYYPSPGFFAKKIKDRIAFGEDIEIIE